MKTSFRVVAGLLAAAALIAPGLSLAETEYALAIRNHRFEPEELVIPAGQKVRIVVTNHDQTPEEFESDSLRREKIIPAGGRAVLFIGPLGPGAYPFVGEFNPTTAKGRLVVR